MAFLTTELATVLGTVRRPGDFAAFGTTELSVPQFEVEGVGPLALPLLPVQAAALIAVAERAPYGRGPETLHDSAVRRTWQIGAERVRIGGQHWLRMLDGIVVRAAEGLGVVDPVSAELYKLLLYGEGDFFVSHRDTEKAPGMFATLVIALPSVSTGGALVVRHKDRVAEFDLRCEDPAEVAFAAFYADCPHEVLPVTAGHRLVLIYNLTRREPGPAPEPPDHGQEIARVAALLDGWGAGKDRPEDDTPEKLVYPLEHAYTQAELGFATLKGADAAVAAVAAAAARQAGCALHLALLSIEEIGIAEYSGGYGGRWSEPDEDAFEAVEVTQRSELLTDWRRPDGTPSPLGEIPIEEDEVSPPEALEDLEPDEEHFREATGNEGASFERTYRRAALVLWPQARLLAVLNQAGLPTTLPYLEDLTERWAAAGADRQSPLWLQAHDLAGHMLATWPHWGWYPGQDKEASDVTRVLGLLTRLADRERIDAFLESSAAGDACTRDDAEAVVAAAGLLAPERSATLIAGIIAGTARRSLDACGALLERAAAARPPDLRSGLRGAAGVLLEALPGEPARVVPGDAWTGRSPAMSSGFVVGLLTALGMIDGALAGRAAEHLLAWPATYDLDGVLVPAAIQLVGSAATRYLPAVERLRTACVAHLRARIAEPLEPPQDWGRTSVLACSCPQCREISSFLADPIQKTWVFKAAEPQRSHVEATIRRAGSDLDVATDRRGRPYSLVAIKNQASYDRRVVQRRQDLADVARLDV
ncbi:2OG-Fe(II) oxygenase [Azospirillum sp. sgz301742]